MFRARQIAALAVLLAGPAHATCTLGYATEVPMRQHGAGLFVPAAVNGQPVEFMLGTADWATLIGGGVAAPLRLARDVGIGTHIGGDTFESSRGRLAEVRVRARSFTIGRYTRNDVPMHVLPDPDMAHFAVLGMHPLDLFDIDIDVQGGRLILYGARGGCAKPAVALSGELYIAPMRPSPLVQYYGSDLMEPETPEPVLTAVIGGHKLDTEMEVSGQHSRISRAAADRLGLTVVPLPPGAAGKGERGATSAGPVTIGELTIPHLPLRVVDELPSRDGYRDLVLGADMLRHTHVWISNSSRTVVFQIPPAPSPPAPNGAASK